MWPESPDSMPMSVAIDIYLKQIAFTGGIPFPVQVPHKLLSLENLTPEQLDAELEKGYQDYKEGRVLTAAESYALLKKEFKI